MTAIIGIFGPGASTAPLDAMMARAGTRGDEVRDRWTSDEAVLAVARHAWESAPSHAGPARVSEERGCACVTDASLFYRDELARALAAAGQPVVPEAPPASLIIAAYRAWGPACASRLEGDFAFILYDREQRRVVAATEFTGKRPLFQMVPAGTATPLVIASSVRAIAEHPSCPRGYDERVLAATISQLWACDTATWQRGVHEIAPGTTLIRDARAEPRVVRHWHPRLRDTRTSFDDAARELRRLLEAATAERLAASGPTGIWMSGGWDSPAVFVSGQARLRAAGDDRSLLPVSLSYPEGDPGREDALITSIAAHWDVPVRWVDVESIPLFVDPADTAGRRDAPFAHTYEHWNRRLAAETRTLGTRVALDGNGGDQLFQLSDVFLADLLRQHRWSDLAREWRAKDGGANWRAFLRLVVVPGAPGIRRLAEAVRGRAFLAPGERRLPPWIREDFVRRHALLEWERAGMDALRGDDEWHSEVLRFLLAPAFGRGFAALGDFARDAGVELRSPLLDARVVDLALSRPREERNTGLETKRLLRRAMDGLLPAHVLAPRTHRTGITSAYSDRRMREAMPALLDHVLAEPMVLADLGIVEPAALREGWQRYLRNGAAHVKIPLFLTVQAELWLRARRREETAAYRAPDGVRLERLERGGTRVHRHAVFAGVLQSDMPFPELPAADGSATADWTLRLGRVPPPHTGMTVLGEEPLADGVTARLHRDERHYVLTLEDTGTFAVSRDGREITWSPAAGASEELARLDVIGRALPLARHAAGAHCLHASAVVLGDVAVAFIGPKGAGKSTTAMALVHQGARLLTDDTLPVQAGDGVAAHPGVHGVRLREDAAQRFAAGQQLPPTRNVDKLLLAGFPETRLARASVRLGAVYLLVPGEASGREERRRLSPLESALVLVAHGKLARLLGGDEAGRALHRAAAIAREVPVYALTIGRELDALDAAAGTLAAWHVTPPAGG